MYPLNIKEEEIKKRVGKDWFSAFDDTLILGNIDFCVSLKKEQSPLFDTQSLYWAESKRGRREIVAEMITQLILTIGKERTYEKMLPPQYVGCFDAEKIAFIEYNSIQHFFYQNDFNWNVTPSKHDTKEFKQVQKHVEQELQKNFLVFNYDNDRKELAKFISENFKLGSENTRKIKITKNNFVPIFTKWLDSVKKSINIDWEEAKKQGILPADFYLADLLSDNNKTLGESLYVLLDSNQYKLGKKKNTFGGLNYSSIYFFDNQKAYNAFWNHYDRPPKEEYWNYIIDRRDILVPQDIREVKGSYFTPKRWVDLSQDYMAKQFGEDWQDEYYIWDCAAGTGNLLANLTNAAQIWASTLDEPDINAMHEIAARKGINLLDKHIFQFDFLNDPLTKLPDSLRKVIFDNDKRKKLIIYINPPYKEPGNKRQPKGTGKNQAGVSDSNIKERFKAEIGQAINEMSIQFWMRAYKDLYGCKLCSFAKTKVLNGSQSIKFRDKFKSDLKSLFLVPADTFDNVKGNFSIGFFIWETNGKKGFQTINADLYDAKGNQIGTKNITALSENQYILTWLRSYYDNTNDIIAYLRMTGTDVGHNRYVSISNGITENDRREKKFANITQHNILPMCVYVAIRKIVFETWLNDRDQYLVPEETWKDDRQFVTDCLVFTLFENDFRREFELVNNWIPYTEQEVDAKDSFDSHFMSNVLNGKTKLTIEKIAQQDKKKSNNEINLFEFEPTPEAAPFELEFSEEAKAVLDAGKALYTYYHQQPNIYINASLRDIKVYFQGVNEKGNLLTGSDNETYNKLLSALNSAMKDLADNIRPKIFEHGFMQK